MKNKYFSPVLMNRLTQQAYDRYTKTDRPQFDKEELWGQCSIRECIAVFAIYLHTQVANGGFTQWFDNGYGDCARDAGDAGDRPNLIELLNKMNDEMPARSFVAARLLVEKAWIAFEQYERDQNEDADECNCDEGDECWCRTHDTIQEEAYATLSDTVDALGSAFYLFYYQLLRDVERYLIAHRNDPALDAVVSQQVAA